MKRQESVSNWTPAKPTQKLVDSKVLQPNAHDNPDSLAPTGSLGQALGKSGKPSGNFGARGRGF